MKKVLFIAVMSFMSIGAFASQSDDAINSANIEKSKSTAIVAEMNILTNKKQQNAVALKRFPITFETSCGTWTGTASCGTLTITECGTFLNDVGEFLESLC